MTNRKKIKRKKIKRKKYSFYAPIPLHKKTYSKTYTRKKRPRYLEKIMILMFLSSILYIVTALSISQLRSFGPELIVPEETQEVKENKEQFIETLVPVANEMNEAYGILPSIIIAQAILESNWGTSELSYKYNNLFGMKSFNPQANSVSLATKEFINGQWIDIYADFRVYPSWEESIREHTALLVQGVDWDPYLYQGVLLADDYKTAAKALQMAGYATDPGYAKKLSELIKQHKLYDYDPK